jgi:hypothetical protein
MPLPSLEDLFVSLLDPDGEPMTNQVLRLRMGKALERKVTLDEFQAAREPLLKSGVLGRMPGQGGRTYRLPPPPPPEPEKPARSRSGRSEASLMAPLGQYLREVFGPALELPKARYIVQDTSRTGPPTGLWERSDYVLVAVSGYRYLPGLHVDVHSFELKTEAGGDVKGVHEALAHSHQTDFAYLVWHLPIGSKAEKRLEAVEISARKHGIGLILMRDPEDPGLTEIRIDAQRRTTERDVVDEFLHMRLTQDNLAGIVTACREIGR